MEKKFCNMNEFTKWKEEYEKETTTYFVNLSGSDVRKGIIVDFDIRLKKFNFL